MSEPSADPEAPAPRRGRELVRDFAAERTAKPVPEQVQRRLLHLLYPKFLGPKQACRTSPGDYDGDLAKARAAGEFTPVVGSMFEGSFTTAHARETAILVQRSECNATHADNYGSAELVIFAGDTLVARLDIDWSVIDLVRDFDGDGVDELLLTIGDTHMGYTVLSAAVGDVKNGALAIRQPLGEVYEDACGTGEAASKIQSAKVWSEGGRLSQETTTAPCPTTP